MQGFPMDSHVTWTVDPDTGATMPEFDRAVTSEPLREYIKGVITNGVLPNPSNNLQVSAGTNGMTVLVNAGFCVIEGGLAIEPNTRTLEVTSADSTYDRIDTVVARWDSNDATRRVDLHIVKGVPASTPVRPTLTRNESIYELGLADVFVTKGVATITNEKITDTRMESARCGICSSIAEWDTTTIYQQVQADLKQFKSSEQAAFMDWFNRMKDQLTEDAAGRLQTEVDEVRGQIHTNLLNPTLGTTTVNGVTITNNNDGTYTLTGKNTGTGEIWFNFFGAGTKPTIESLGLKVGATYRYTCIPTNAGSANTFWSNVAIYNGTTQIGTSNDYGSGGKITIGANVTNMHFGISIRTGIEFPSGGLVIKPMLTADLSATYNDFVQYSGDGELNQNVAEIFNKVEEHETRLDSAETTIGNHTNQIAQVNSDLASVESSVDAKENTIKIFTLTDNFNAIASNGNASKSHTLSAFLLNTRKLIGIEVDVNGNLCFERHHIDNTGNFTVQIINHDSSSHSPIVTTRIIYSGETYSSN